MRRPYRNLADQSAPFGLDFSGFHGKNHRYTYQQVRELLFSIKEIANEDIEKTIDLFLRNCGKVGIDYGKAK